MYVCVCISVHGESKGSEVWVGSEGDCVEEDLRGCVEEKIRCGLLFVCVCK